jgi:hypothetical protein
VVFVLMCVCVWVFHRNRYRTLFFVYFFPFFFAWTIFLAMPLKGMTLPPGFVKHKLINPDSHNKIWRATIYFNPAKKTKSLYRDKL